MNEEEKKAIESVKDMFGVIPIEELIKNKDINVTVYSLGIVDVLRVIGIVEKQQKEYDMLLTGYTKLVNKFEKQQKVIDEMRRELERHIKFCEQESKGHINNEVCHISLKFNKKLLEIINRKVEDNG